MGADFSKTESESLALQDKAEKRLKHGLPDRITQFMVKSKAFYILPVVTILLLALSIASASIWGNLILSFTSCLTSYLFGKYLIQHKISQSLEEARQHLEETSDLFSDLEDFESSSGEASRYGIPELDSLYNFAESAVAIPGQELSKLREEFELVLNNIAAAVMLHDSDGTAKFCSSYIEVLTGYSLSELSSLSDEDFILAILLPEDLERYKRARAVSQLGEDTVVRFQVKHKSGLILWLENRMVPIIDESGGVQSVMSVMIDVSDSINYQRQIEQQNQDLSDFAYMVSHDLKAPVFTIQGMASALKDDFSETVPVEAMDLLEFIIGAAERLDKLVASVLEYSALSNSNETPAEVNLSESLGQVLSDHSEQLKAFEHHFQIPSTLPTIKADPIRVYQIFSNLIGNAIKYRDQSRPLEVSISYEVSPPQSAIIFIKDNGLGIPSSKLTDIFRPYRRAHGSDIEGSGIGLACVKKIVERLGGEVNVNSTEGHGSTFSVQLPLANPVRRSPPEDLARIF